ncbi:MAG: metallophosphoesterase [Xanthomonadales bacterium]
MTDKIPLAGEFATLRIIQISDCHVSADPDALYRGQSPDANLRKILQLARRWNPALILLTGDVSEDGSRQSYQRTSGLLARAGVPVLALPGNHDDVEVMRRYFPVGPWDGPQVIKAENWQLVLLDSTEPNRIDGCFSASRLEQIRASLHDKDREHTLVALHHQPVPVGAPWIDRYMLESPGRFLEVIDRSLQARCVVWGHVHHDFRLQRKGMILLGAPSSVANSIPGAQRFTLDQMGPACRWLELSARGEVNTGVLNLNKH